MNAPNLDELIPRILAADKAGVALALNLVEDQRPALRASIDDLLQRLEKAPRRAHVVGMTGPPGVGKSTLTGALIQELRQRGRSVGIVAVDPTSKRTGGALLGDRARIRYDSADTGIFVRSMASGDQLGGLARATQAAVEVMQAAYDVVVVETVGIGQSETDIEDIADTVVFVVQPGSGDTLQFMKSGIMEIPDLLVINKADQEKLARRAMLDLKGTLTYREAAPGGWVPEALRTSAVSGLGLPEFVEAVDRHAAWLRETGLEARRREKGARWALTTFTRLAGELAVERLGGKEALAVRLRGSRGETPREFLRQLLDLLQA